MAAPLATFLGYFLGYVDPFPPKLSEIINNEKKSQIVLNTLVENNMPLFGKMPKVKIELADKLTDTNQQRSEYIPGTGTIRIKRSYYVETSPEKLNEVVKHEMTHVATGSQKHDMEWKCKAKEAGVADLHLYMLKGEILNCSDKTAQTKPVRKIAAKNDPARKASAQKQSCVCKPQPLRR